MTPPDVVYAHQDGATYVAGFDDGDFWRWPAVADGWRSRARCSESTADGAEELLPRLAELALKLSGVPTDD